MLLTVPHAFYLSLAVAAARRILQKASPSRETPGESQYDILLFHEDGQSVFVATCETRRSALELDSCLRQATGGTPFYTRLRPNVYVDPDEEFTNGADAFRLEPDDFRKGTAGFTGEFIASFNSRLSAFTSPRSV